MRNFVGLNQFQESRWYNQGLSWLFLRILWNQDWICSLIAMLTMVGSMCSIFSEVRSKSLCIARMLFRVGHSIAWCSDIARMRLRASWRSMTKTSRQVSSQRILKKHSCLKKDLGPPFRTRSCICTRLPSESRALPIIMWINESIVSLRFSESTYLARLRWWCWCCPLAFPAWSEAESESLSKGSASGSGSPAELMVAAWSRVESEDEAILKGLIWLN